MDKVELSGHNITTLSADLRLTRSDSVATTDLAVEALVTFDLPALLACAHNPIAYGQTLSQQLFADAHLRDAWLKARAHAAGDSLQLRLRLDPRSDELHALRWETLCDPDDGNPLAMDERIRLIRTLDSADLTPISLRPQPELRALVIVSNPNNLSTYGLDEVDVDGEVSRVRTALGDVPCTILGDHSDAVGRSMHTQILDHLRDAPPIVVVIAHGTIVDRVPYLWLEQEDGTADQVAGADFVTAVERLTTRPLFFLLLSCRSAGHGYAETLNVLGPRLAQIGIPAVLAFQGAVTMSTVKALLPTFISEMRRDGQIDRALAAARIAIGMAQPWWQPVLWLRTDGRLWLTDPRDSERRQRLILTRSRHSQERFRELRSGFVGREQEIATIQAANDALRETGGYLLVTGVAGQGKSSVLAAFIAAHSADQTPAYFIRFSPGADEQVALLRHLVAELLIQFDMTDLSDSYLPENAGAITLANSLAMVLDRISGAGRQVTLVIDGLDQIRPDYRMGERDLSFLPEQLPSGVVFVIGTRPDDTLKPLNVLASQQEYKLPPLSVVDFAALLATRGTTVAEHDRDAIYKALHGNAFDLAFVVRELAETAAADVSSLLDQVRRNPQDIFAQAIKRLLSDEPFWRRVIRPILGCLLAATDSEPLSEDALCAILRLDTDQVSEALLRLRGFLGEIDRNGRTLYYLYHLKLIEYLKKAPSTAGVRIFSPHDHEQYHQHLVAWCEGEAHNIHSIWEDVSNHMLEQERRRYARQHYIMHLAAARAYKRLWAVIDAGDYGNAKRANDPSTLSYVQDLDIARRSVIVATAGTVDAQIRALPRMWRYSLLRCSLSNRADSYPEALFLALVALGRSYEAINLAELLSAPLTQSARLQAIGHALLRRGDESGLSLLLRAARIAEDASATIERVQRLCAITTLLFYEKQSDDAETIVRTARVLNVN
jgi:hypothetical protein